MDEYARNFKRAGVDSAKDLLWFGKLEHFRCYTHKDPEVKSGEKQRGERKPGEQMHIQVIVSRKDITNSIKLSPMNNSRGQNAAHSQKLGQFDRSAFKQAGEQVFDRLFEFDRGLKDSYEYANTQKKGTLAERLEMQKRVNAAPQKTTKPAQKQQSALTLSMPMYKADVAFQTSKKKKKRKGQEPDLSL